MSILWRFRVALKQAIARIAMIVEFCRDCGRAQPLVWVTTDALWTEVTGQTDGGGVLCPECFDRRARSQDRLLYWIPREER